MPKEVEELVFVWASRLSPYPWVRFDYPFPFVIRSKNRGELQCLLKQLIGCVNKQNCRIWSEANTQVYVETPLHSEKLTVWCALWAGGILLQKR
ncbi:hypothetical protein TNCV_3277391 [Trichonephila clavipes]|nr:hypothetical protein TNCV_3277391 [Trichonephila clavipes]